MPQLTEMMLYLDALIKIKTQLLIAYSTIGGKTERRRKFEGDREGESGEGGGERREADRIEARQGITFGCQSER